MWHDPIVEEVRRFRQEYAAQFNHNLRAICNDLRKRQMDSGREAVTLPPKRPRQFTAESQSAPKQEVASI